MHWRFSDAGLQCVATASLAGIRETCTQMTLSCRSLLLQEQTLFFWTSFSNASNAIDSVARQSNRLSVMMTLSAGSSEMQCAR